MTCDLNNTCRRNNDTFHRSATLNTTIKARYEVQCDELKSRVRWTSFMKFIPLKHTVRHVKMTPEYDITSFPFLKTEPEGVSRQTHFRLKWQETASLSRNRNLIPFYPNLLHSAAYIPVKQNLKALKDTSNPALWLLLVGNRICLQYSVRSTLSLTMHSRTST
jgi:hypothetical protein